MYKKEVQSVISGPSIWMYAQLRFRSACAFVLCLHMTKTCRYNIDPLKPHFYSKTGVYRDIHYFLIFAQKHRLWVLVEPPRQGGSNEYPQSMF